MTAGLGLGLVSVRLFTISLLWVFLFSLDYFFLLGHRLGDDDLTRLELRCVHPSVRPYVRPYVHKKFFPISI